MGPAEALAVALVLLVTASGCGVWAGLGDKERWAEEIREAPGTARAHGTAQAGLEIVRVHPVETTLRDAPEPMFRRMTGGVVFPDTAGEPGELFEGGMARFSVQEPQAQAEVPVLFYDLRLFLPRQRQGDGPPWVGYEFRGDPDLEEIDVTDRRLAVGLNVFNPVFLVDLLHGALTGSVEMVGEATISDGGEEVPVVRYRANFSRDAATRDVFEFRREAVLRMFEVMGVGDEIFPGEVWIDEEGRPRRIRYVMEQQQDRVNIFRTSIDLELGGYGTEVEVPDEPAERMGEEEFGSFVEEFMRTS